MGASTRLALVALALFAGTASAQNDPYYDEAPVAEQPQYDPNYAPPPQYANYWYMGTHPVPYDVGSGYCYSYGAHSHEYPPFDQYLFRESGGYWYFIGDPADFGYTMQMWGYNAEHPIPSTYGGGYCYMTWPHRHPYSPPSSVYFNFVGGYYRYTGPWDPYYYQYRGYYSPYYSGYYRNNYYGGRYWTVRPPPIHRVGVPGVVVGPPGGYRPGVGVRPGVTVTPPGVGIGVAPPPRVYAPGVNVGPPPPHMRVSPPVYHSPPVYNHAPRVYTPPPMHVAPPRVYSPPMHVAPPRMHAPAPMHRPSMPSGGGMRVAPPPAFRR